MRQLLVVVCCLGLLSGCGSSMTPEQRLQDKVARLVAEANARDLAGLQAATGELRAEIEKQTRAGELTLSRVDLLQAVAAIERDAALLNGDPTPPASPTPSPLRSQEPAKDDGKDDGKGDGKDDGKGDGKGGGKDDDKGGGND